MKIKFYNNYDIIRKTKDGIIDILPRFQIEWVKSVVFDTVNVSFKYGWLIFECAFYFEFKCKGDYGNQEMD